MDPLSIATAIVGLITAAAQVSSSIAGLIDESKKAPQEIVKVKREVDVIQSVLLQVRELLIRGLGINQQRTSMILVDQVVITLSTCVSTFSELDVFVKSLKSGQKMGLWGRLRWATRSSAVVQYLTELEKHKITLSLIVTTLTCESANKAEEAVGKLNATMEEVLKSHKILAQRFESDAPFYDNGLQRHAFEEELEQSWVYKSMVRGTDRAFSITSENTWAVSWSIFSGMSLSDISNFAIVALPIYAEDINNRDLYKFGEFDRGEDGYANPTEPGRGSPLSRIPDLVIGIDFGMAFTAVAYQPVTTQHHSKISIVDRWPGSDQMQRMVPTLLIYDRILLESWGFLCGQQQPRTELFKQYLGPETLVRAQHGRQELSFEEADIDRFHIDYLQKLHGHLRNYFENIYPNWAALEVSFQFATPLSYSALAHMNFRRHIECAGFAEGSRHSFDLRVREPEAVITYVANLLSINIGAGDVILVCDAGVATTNCCLLGIESVVPFVSLEFSNLELLVHFKSIDDNFVKLIERRLEALERQGIEISGETARQMVHSPQGQQMKTVLGANINITIPIPGVATDFHSSEAGIQRGRMHFTDNEIKGLFYPHIEEIWRNLTSLLDEFEKSHPGDQIDHFILTGGLGDSKVLRDFLANNIINTGFHRRFNGNQFKILVSDYPPNDVAKGLVLAKRNQLDQSSSARQGNVNSRVPRVSYGILRAERFDPKRHYEKDAVIIFDPVTGAKYVNNVIKWFFTKGDDFLPATAIQLGVWTMAYKKDVKTMVIKDQIVICYDHVDQLPMCLPNERVHKLCTISFDLAKVPLPPRPPRQIMSRPKLRERDYESLTHQLEVVIGYTDMKFRLLAHGRQVIEETSVKLV